MRVALLGPIGWWWSCWDSEAHQTYVAHRQELHDALVDSGHLVYSPHNAWKGLWPENDGDATAQTVNDAAIRCCQIAVNMTPLDVLSPGTEHELKLCKAEYVHVVAAPPGHSLVRTLLEVAAGGTLDPIVVAPNYAMARVWVNQHWKRFTRTPRVYTSPTQLRGLRDQRVVLVQGVPRGDGDSGVVLSIDMSLELTHLSTYGGVIVEAAWLI